jgi:hypothetical protein
VVGRTTVADGHEPMSDNENGLRGELGADGVLAAKQGRSE